MKTKKILAALLSSAMVLGTMAVPAFADGNVASVTINGATTNYTDFHEALNAALNTTGVNNATITLLADITYDENATWEPVVFTSAHTLTFVGADKTITNLPGMMFNKTGSGGQHLIMSDVTFESPKAESPEKPPTEELKNAAVIIGYADSVNELTFTNVHINNATVKAINYAGAFFGYAAGYNTQTDGPVFAQHKITNCSVTNSTFQGGNSTGALIGHAAGNPWTEIVITNTTVTGNTITGPKASKTGILIGTLGVAQYNQEKQGGVWIQATESGNKLTEGQYEIGRIGSTGGTGYFTAGGSYTVNPLETNDPTTGSITAEEGYSAVQKNGVWTIANETAAEPVAKIGTTEYETLAAAVEAASNGDTITLLTDIELSETVVIEKDLTIDLAGMGIYATDTRALWIKSGDVTITGGNYGGQISADVDENNPNSTFQTSSSAIRVGDSAANPDTAKLTIDELVNVTSDHCYGVTVFGKNAGEIEFVLNGTISVSGEVPALSGNGSTGLSATKMIINGKVYGMGGNNEYAIYHPGMGTLTVNGNSVISGGNGGIEAKAGNIIINGGSISATGTAIHPSANNNGTSTSGYALVAVDNANYQGPAVITVNDGYIEGSVGIVDDNNGASSHSSISITGGTFSEDPQAYLASGKSSEKINDTEYIVINTANTREEIANTVIETGDAVTIKSATVDNFYDQVTATMAQLNDKITFRLKAVGGDYGDEGTNHDITLEGIKASGTGFMVCGLIITNIPDNVTVTTTIVE